MKAYVYSELRAGYGVGAISDGGDITVIFAERKPTDVSANDVQEMEIVAGATINISFDRHGYFKVKFGTMSLPGE